MERCETFSLANSCSSKVTVTLQDEIVRIENHSSNCWFKPKVIQVPTCEILAVQRLVGRNLSQNRNQAFVAPVSYNRVPNQSSNNDLQNSLVLHYMKRSSRKPSIWSLKQLTLKHCHDDVIDRWHDYFLEIMRFHAAERPKNLLVVINPYGGKKKARQIYLKYAAPIFKLAEIATTVIETEYANHAFEVMMQYPLDELDGVVAVGGDGVFNEIFNGLLRRTNLEHGIDVNDTSSHPLRYLIIDPRQTLWL